MKIAKVLELFIKLSFTFIIYKIIGQFTPFSKIIKKPMASLRMSPNMVQQIKETVERLNFSTDTYFHTILLFNVIQLKSNPNNTDKKAEYVDIPGRKRNISGKSSVDSSLNNNTSTEPYAQCFTFHHTNMFEYDKIYIATCLFLVHKLYQLTPSRLSDIMSQMGIDERFEKRIISLEMEILVKLGFKIQNLLPSNQTIFASLLWDQFVQNIDQTCIDVRFGIDAIFQHSKQQIRIASLRNKAKIQPEFKVIQTRQSFNALSQNIQILVHNQALYKLYLKNSAKQSQDDIQAMKKIGLAITYVTISQQTRMNFNKKYFLKRNMNLDLRNQKNQYLEFVFNDFLNETYGLKLDDLTEQIQVVYIILDQHARAFRLNNQRSNKNMALNNSIKGKSQQKFAQFILRSCQIISEESNDKYHSKNKENLSFSMAKTDNQLENMRSFCSKDKYHSILSKKSNMAKNKHLQSTFHQSNISQNEQSLIGQKQNKKSGTLCHKKFGANRSYSRKINQSSKGFEFSYVKNDQRSTLKISSNKHQNSAQSNNTHEGHYKVSQFISIDV